MKQFFILLALYFCILSSPSAQTKIFFVKPNAKGDGSSWANALPTITDALKRVNSGDEIWVNEGTYYPINCQRCTDVDRYVSFEIPSGVKLFGGFTGKEKSLAERSWQLHPTILSGDINHDNTPKGNSCTIVATKNVSESTLLDGFIISGGNADLDTMAVGSRLNCGGAWFNDGEVFATGSNPIAQNCTFYNNYAWAYGGAVYNNGGFSGKSNPKYINCTFRENIAGRSGGAICNNGQYAGESSSSFQYCYFIQNRAKDGGAVYNWAVGSLDAPGISNSTFSACVFTLNQANETGGAVYNFGKLGKCSGSFNGCVFTQNKALEGGTIYNDGTSGLCSPIFSGCSFLENTAVKDGAVMFNTGASDGDCHPTIENCAFIQNHSINSGACLFNYGVQGRCNPNIINSRFSKNVADAYGGALYNLGQSGMCSPTITNSVFYENTASSAGAIYNLGSLRGNSNAVITNCSFYGNKAKVGGAIYANANDETGTCNPIVTNCIFYGNVAEFGSVFRCIRSSPVVSYCLIDMPDCESLNSGIGSAITCKEGIIFDKDPLFTNVYGGDLHLRKGSPAIDAGNTLFVAAFSITSDMDSLPRVVNGKVDMGAYEFFITATEEAILLENKLSVVPNPSNGSFLWKTDEPLGIVELRLIDYQGRLLYRHSNIDTRLSASEMIDVPQLENGLYLLQCIGNKINVTKKILIQK